MTERVTFDDDGHLDEVAVSGGAHMEHLGGNDWFLSFQRKDGSSFAVWMTGKITDTESRDAPKCKGCGRDIEANPPTDGPYIMCPECGWSARPKTPEASND